jgi:capsule polysaccharide export protein KpsE/RkpR
VSGLASTFHLSPTEYLYYWNEVRIRGFRGQLNYQQAVVAEIQEDLRQANAALADLEKLAGQTDPQDADGNPDQVSTLETSLIDHHQAIIAHANREMYGPSDSHVYSSWQTNRVRLKSYIDRRTADAQSASLDLQQTTNRFNNAYEVMAKLQEKMDGLIKTQLRNW